jgi:hypothetical protein
LLKKTLKEIREELCEDGVNTYTPVDLTEKDGDEKLDENQTNRNKFSKHVGYLDEFFPEGTFMENEDVEMERMKVSELTGRSGTSILVDDIGSAALDKFKKSSSTLSSGIKTRYEVIDGGKDVILNFGRHKGEKVSRISLIDQSYLLWMIRSNDFPIALMDIVKKFV